MATTRKFVLWSLLFLVLAAVLGAGVYVFFVSTNNQPHIPPCEAMRPYIKYQGVMYFEAMDNTKLTQADLGSQVATLGDQAQSCLASGTAVYSVKGHSVSEWLALNGGGEVTLFEAYHPTPTPVASPTRS